MLPLLNANKSEDNLGFFAYVHDDSLKKIFDTNKKLFGDTLKNTNKNISKSFKDTIEKYKADTIPFFESMSQTLEKLSNVSIGTSPIIDKVTESIGSIHDDISKLISSIEENADNQKKEKVRDDLKEEERENKRNAKRGFLGRVGESVTDFGKSVATKDNLINPSHLLGTLTGSFFGTSLGKSVLGAAALPAAMITNPFKHPVAWAVTAIAASAFKSIQDSNMIAEATNNSQTSAALAGFIAGNGSDDVTSKALNYGGMMGTGAVIGFAAGGPIGALAGALVGGALTMATRALGPDFFADYLTIGVDKLRNFATGFGIIDSISSEDAKKKFDEQKQYVTDLNTKLNSLEDERTKLLEATRNAIESGNTELAKKLSEQQIALQDKKKALIANIERETIKLTDAKNQFDIASQNSITDRVYTWLGLDKSGSIYDFASKATDHVQKYNESDEDYIKRETERGKQFDESVKKGFLGGINWLNDAKNSTIDTLGNGFDWFNKTLMPSIAPVIPISPADKNVPMSNLFTDQFKTRDLKFQNLAKDNSETGSFQRMLNGMNNFVTNNSTVNNSSVTNKNFITKSPSTIDPTFQGYGRSGY